MGAAWPKAVALLGHWGAPPDLPAAIALAIGGVLLAIAIVDRRGHVAGELLFAPPSRGFAGIVGLAAAFLSLGYAAHYLRGGPRIIDATHYFLQARALAEGHVAWPIPMPSASFRGRFLVSDGTTLAGIFPPGWPLVLSLGFRIGAPLVVGPLLGLGLVFATRALTLALAERAGMRRDEAERPARLAALLSLVCAALRYHTADTMAHGATALALTLAMLAVLEARKAPSRGRFFLVGLALGAILATRVVSSFAPALVALFVAVRAPRLPRNLGFLALGALPGALLLAAAAKASTGSALVLPQTLYYATSDGPPGCFRYGFGPGVGCVVEHGDFVLARLQGGFGPMEALGTTARRLHLHAGDVLGAWPLGILVALPAMVRAARTPAARIVAVSALLHVLAYVPFYFDGSYPGGGARLFADILPMEHALVALGLAPLAGARAGALPRRALALVGAVLVGFGIHGSFAHLALAGRDGGRPMVFPEELPARTGLLFVDTDHAFALLHSTERDPTKGLVVARLRDDAHDRLLHDRLGSPPTLVHRFHDGTPTVEWWTPPPATDLLGHEVWRFEGESDWPPLAQRGGWASQAWASTTCASGGRVLELRPTPGDPAAEASATLALPIPHAARWRLTVSVLLRGTGGEGALVVRGPGGAVMGRADWSDAPRGGPPSCADVGAPVLDLPEGEWRLDLQARSGPVALDKVTLAIDPGPR